MLNSVDAAPLTQPPENLADQKVGYAAKIIEYQSELRQMLVAETKNFKRGKSSSILFSIIFISFVYGAVHAIGPGHNKGAVSAYVISNKSKRLKSAVLGFSSGIMHGVGTIGMVLLIYYVTDYRLGHTFDTVSKQLMLYCSVGIIVIGLVNLVSSVQERKQSKIESSIFIFLSGLVPCPAILVILSFFISSGFISIGVAAALALTLGMSLSLSIISLSASQASLLLNGGNGRWQSYFRSAGALAVILFGVLLYLNI